MKPHRKPRTAIANKSLTYFVWGMVLGSILGASLGNAVAIAIRLLK